MKWSIACIFVMLPIIILIKIITKKQVAVFVVIFLFAMIGYFITICAIEEKNIMYGMEEKDTVVIGRVSKISETAYGWNIFLEQVEIEHHMCRKILISVDEMSDSRKISDVNIGNVVEVYGRVGKFEGARNKGNFDSQKYYMSLGIYLKIHAGNFQVVDKKYDFIRQNIFHLKGVIGRTLSDICGDTYKGVWKVCNEKASIFSAVLLGDKSELNQEVKALYSSSGIAHILAISGLHVSFIGMSVYSLFRKRFKFTLSASFSMGIVVGFGLMSGMGIATIRAIVMFGLRLLGEVLGRTYDNLTAISTAGILLMIGNPFIVLNSGFQMSFAAIVAIVIIFPVVQNILRLGQGHRSKFMGNEKNMSWKQRQMQVLEMVKNKLVKAIVFSFTISIVMNPVIAYNYYQIPTYSFLLNIIVVPFMSVVIISGLVGIGGAFVNVFLGRGLILPGCVVLELYEVICRLVSRIPFSNVIVGKPKLWTIVSYYVLLAAFLVAANLIRERIDKKHAVTENQMTEKGKVIDPKNIRIRNEQKINFRFRAVTILMAAVVSGFIYFHFPKGFQVTFMDVGQGDGIFIRAENGVTITIDGGSSSVDKVGKYRIIPYLKAECEKKIDYAIVTHADYDHISGLLELLEQSDKNGIQVKNLVLPDIQLKDASYHQMIRTAIAHKVSVLYITKGNEIKAGNVKIKCIYPSGSNVAEDRNDYSTVLYLSYGRFSMLLTGDISTKPEKEIKALVKNHYTVLKVAHHGSKYSTSNEFLQWVNPDYSVISVGEHNMYGHPSDETLERLKQSGSKVLRTDESGAIVIKMNRNKMQIEKNIK